LFDSIVEGYSLLPDLDSDDRRLLARNTDNNNWRNDVGDMMEHLRDNCSNVHDVRFHMYEIEGFYMPGGGAEKVLFKDWPDFFRQQRIDKIFGVGFSIKAMACIIGRDVISHQMSNGDRQVFSANEKSAMPLMMKQPIIIGYDAEGLHYQSLVPGTVLKGVDDPL
jgi:hypothetical protein